MKYKDLPDKVDERVEAIKRAQTDVRNQLQYALDKARETEAAIDQTHQHSLEVMRDVRKVIQQAQDEVKSIGSEVDELKGG
jgi:uncharacterized protein YukE